MVRVTITHKYNKRELMNRQIKAEETYDFLNDTVKGLGTVRVLSHMSQNRYVLFVKDIMIELKCTENIFWKIREDVLLFEGLCTW